MVNGQYFTTRCIVLALNQVSLKATKFFEIRINATKEISPQWGLYKITKIISTKIWAGQGYSKEFEKTLTFLN